MPYIIKKVSYGFKVCKKDNPNVCFSKKPITKKKAIKQRTAINLSNLGITGKGALFSKINPDVSDPKYHKRMIEQGKLEKELSELTANLKSLKFHRDSFSVTDYNKAKKNAEDNIKEVKKALREL